MKMRRVRFGILLALSAVIVIAAVFVILRAAQANALKREYTALTAEAAPGGGAGGIVPAVDISQVKAAYIESPLSAVKIKYYYFNLHDPDEKNIVAAVLKLIYSNQDSAVKGGYIHRILGGRSAWQHTRAGA